MIPARKTNFFFHEAHLDKQYKIWVDTSSTIAATTDEIWILNLPMYFKAENMDRTQEVQTLLIVTNFSESRISKYQSERTHASIYFIWH